MKLSREESGNLSLIEMLEPAGAMPPLHTHDEDEGFIVLEGGATFWAGDDIIEVRAGDTFVAPTGVPHTYRIGDDGARWVVATASGRFEDFVRAVSRPPEGPGLPPPPSGPPTPEQTAALVAAAEASGLQILGPPGMLPTER